MGVREMLSRMGETMTYLTNEAGDVWARQTPDGPVEVNPSEEFAWAPRTASEEARTIDEIRGLPGFAVDVHPGDRWIPGPRLATFANFSDGKAAPAALSSVRETLAYYDRLTEALGSVVREAMARPDRCPFTVYDWVSGREIIVTYTPPPLEPGGNGRVYFVTDGEAVKIGFTTKTTASRINDLQTGNPRPIRSILTLHDVRWEVEEKLHTTFDKHRLTGEWFDLGALRGLAESAGGWKALVSQALTTADWNIEMHDDLPSTGAGT